MESVLTFLKSLPENSRIALATHQRPDGDAVGSCVGLGWVLRSLGHKVTLVNISPIPARLYFLNCNLMKQYASPDWYGEFDCMGVLDCGEIGRLDEINQPAATHLPLFNIDHHVSSQGIGQAIWVDGDASSAGEMVVRLCQQAGWPLTTAAARGLWTAIVTDTGRFSFENTTPTCLLAATECLIAGANPIETATHIYQSVSIEERRLQAKILTRLELYEQGKIAISWLQREDFVEAGVGVDGAQDVINLLRDIAGVEVAIFLYETMGDGPGTQSVKVSMRTVSPHNALAIATKYNGGGHKRAAGCSLAATLDEAKSQILVTAKRAFFRYEGDTVSIGPDKSGHPL